MLREASICISLIIMLNNLNDRIKIKQLYLHKQKNIDIIILLIVTITAFTLAGCSIQSDDKEDIHQINEHAIEAILRSSFTCPSLASWESIEKSHEGMTIIGKEVNSKTKSIEKSPMEAELKSIYGSLLTEKYYDLFIGKHALTYEFAAYRTGYEINVNSINVSPSESDPIGYKFVVSVTYGKNNEEKSIAEITGNAQCLEEGKVSYINYTGDGGLLENMEYNIGQ